MKHGILRSFFLWIAILGIFNLHYAGNDQEIEYHDAVAVEWLDQSGNELDYAPEMNVSVSPEQFTAWKAQVPLRQTYVACPESRYKPYRPMHGTIPAVWLDRQMAELGWQDKVRQGEFYVFQIGVFALRQTLYDIRIQISDLENEAGELIPATDATCFNSGGVDIYGNDFTKIVNIPQNDFQVLWIGIQIPHEVQGIFRGKVVLAPANALPTEVSLVLDIDGPPVEDDGVARDRALSRLKWLNSRIAQDDEVTQPYLPIRRSGSRLRILGHELELGENGLPAAITSFYQGSNQSIGENGQAILADPMDFLPMTEHSPEGKIHWSPVEFREETPARCAWRVHGKSEWYSIQVDGSLEYDGQLDFQVLLTGGQTEVVMEDVRLEIIFTPTMSQYMMGLGRRGGRRPDSYEWKWDVAIRGQDSVWLGGVNGGLACRLTGKESLSRQVNVYYQFGPLRCPEGWGNFGRGGMRMRLHDGATRLTAYSGRRALAPGQLLDFGFQLNLTPVKPLSSDALFKNRFYHGYFSVPNALAIGANYVISHHGTYGNEWINYPLLTRNVEIISRKMEELHAAGIFGKLYYTTRETSQVAPELLAVDSLDGEILFPGPGADTRTVILPNGPKGWQQANLRQNFLPGWTFTHKEGEFAGVLDSAVMPVADSRWDNFYLAGLDYLVRKAKIDGFYIDDTLNGRHSLRRARKILDRQRPAANIDLHTWNHFNDMAGWENCLLLYLPILPYLDNLWIGEARNYDFPPDYWLVEISGIPFGVPSQMLQDGGQPWRGMLFGMTARGGCASRCDVSTLWRYWDEIGLAKAKIIGFWELASPVHTSNPLVPATVYQLDGKALIAVANWSAQPQVVELFIDYARLGLSETNHVWRIPAIGDFQSATECSADAALRIPAARGYLIEVSDR